MKIVALGDSITYGFPFSNRESWTTQLAREKSCEVINQGINGDFTFGMLSRFSKDVLHFKPSHVIIMGGTNDAAAFIELEQVKANFISMIEKSRGDSIIPVLGLPIPLLYPQEEHTLAAYRDWLRSYSAENGILTIDFHKPFSERVEGGMHWDLYADMGHPNIDGYKLMGETVVGFFSALTEYRRKKG